MLSKLEVVVHADAGTGPDVMTKAIVKAGVRLGVLPADTIVSHRAGHDGAEAIEYLTSHAGDGALISTCTPTFLTTPLKYGLESTPETLTPICQLVADSYLLVTSTASPWRTARDLVDFAQEKTGTMTVGAAPKGGNNHIHAYLVAEATGTAFDLRFYPTSWDLLQALSSGAVEWTTAVAAELQHEAWRDKLKVIAVLSKERSPRFPDVPTLEEQGIPVTFALWRGLIGPPRMPDDARRELEASLRAITETDEWKFYLTENGQQDAFLDSGDFVAVLRTEESNYRAWLKAIGVIDGSNPIRDSA